jgi:hypothetical protein
MSRNPTALPTESSAARAKKNGAPPKKGERTGTHLSQQREIFNTKEY